MTVEEFLKQPRPEEYDFREEVFAFKGEKSEFARHLAYKGTRGKEADTCDLLKDIWTVLFRGLPFDPLAACVDGKGFHGDTMNSVQTTLNQLFISLADEVGLTLLPGRYKWSFNACKNADPEKAKKVLDHPVGGKVKDLMRVSYTIGNFIPCPVDCNLYVLGDYWDLKLLCVYDWYKYGDDRYLDRLVNGNEKKRPAYKAWLQSFGNWDTYVQKCFLEAFVMGDAAPFGPPRELWDRHFEAIEDARKILPNKSQIKEFFANAAERILARGESMVDALRKLPEEAGE